MGLIDKLLVGSDCSGHRVIPNELGWDNNMVLQQLSNVQTPFGSPKLSWIRAFGKEFQVVVYNQADEDNYLYVNATPDKLVISSAPKPGRLGGPKDHVDPEDLGVDGKEGYDAAAKALAGGLQMMELSDEVDVVADVLQGLFHGMDASRLTVEPKEQREPGTGACLYMEEEVELSLKDRYTIWTEDHEPVFFIEGNVLDTAYRILDADENEVMVIKKKLIALMPEYTVFEGGEKLGSFKKKLRFSKTEIVGQAGDSELTIMGDMLDHSFDILLDGTEIGGMKRELLSWASCYRIEAYNAKDVDLVVAIAAIVEAMIKADQRSS